MSKKTGKNRPLANLNKIIGGWFLQHVQAFLLSLGQLYKNPMNALLTTFVIGISLALPAGFYSFLENARRVTSNWDATSHISLFLKTDIDDQRAQALADELKNHADIKAVEVIDREAALLEYKQNSGFAAALDALEHNPLPPVIIVQPKIESISSMNNERLLKALRALPEVDSGQFDRQWAQRLHRIIEVFQRFIMIVAALLSIAVILVIGNTIRLAIHNRRQEIEINKLFGATDAFIQRPFLYSGLLHGIGGSLIAWLLLEAAVLLLNGPVVRLTDLYGSSFSLVALNFREIVSLLLLGAGLGLAGSWFSVKRHLRAIDLI